MPAGPGRPSKLTPEIQAAYVEAIELGVPPELAARGLRLHPGTVRRWMRQGRKDKQGDLFDFALAVKEAEARGVQANLKGIRQAAEGGQVLSRRVTSKMVGGQMVPDVLETYSKGEWTARAWWLERTQAKFFAKKDSEELARLRKILTDLEAKVAQYDKDRPA